MRKMKNTDRPRVGAAFRAGTQYPEGPFHPPEEYPEFAGSILHAGPVDPQNHVYAMVREAMFRLFDGYDGETNAVDASVLRELGNVKNIVVKPNWVRAARGQRAVRDHARLRLAANHRLSASGLWARLPHHRGGCAVAVFGPGRDLGGDGR